MADIISFTEAYSALVRSWVDSERTYRQLGGRGDWPPSDELITGRQTNQMDAYVLVADRRPVAYAELWPQPQQMALEVRWLLVDPQRRDEGFGSKMLEMLWQRASNRRGIARLVITLEGENREALGCYLRAGFSISGTTGSPGLTLHRLVARVEKL